MSKRLAPENPIYDPRWSAVIAAAGEPPALIYEPPTAPFLSVLYRDGDVLALDKPALLLTVPGKPADHDDCLESRARSAFPGARIVHRLDRPTSGVVIMAMNPTAHRHLGLEFEKRRAKKTYIARVAGELLENEGVIDVPICGDWPRRPRQMASSRDGKPSMTEWRVLSRDQGVTRVELAPKTGRTHQLRVHMAWLGHPILGDEFYAPKTVRDAADRLQLHAERLVVQHPDRQRNIKLVAPCPF